MPAKQEIWRAREVRNVFLKVEDVKSDGTVVVTFELSKLYPKRFYNYHPVYLEQYYESTGQFVTWQYQA